MTPIDPEKLPVLRPPEPQAAVEKSLLALLLRYRFFLVALVIILFFAALFAWGSLKGTAPAKEAQPLAALSHDQAPESRRRTGAAPGPGPGGRETRGPAGSPGPGGPTGAPRGAAPGAGQG